MIDDHRDMSTPESADPNGPPIGIALIGAGMIAPRHIAALSEIQPRARLVSVVSRHPERARTLATHYDGPAPVFTSELASVAEDPGIQMVIVATPPHVRTELIKTLAHEGKHILLEKPVARTLDEAREVVDICEQADCMLGVLFQHQMRATTVEARRLLASGATGKPGLVEIAVPIWREQSYYDELGRGTYARDGGGVMITQAIHAMNLTLSLAGPVSSVQAMTATTPLHQMEAEDYVVAGLRFKSGVIGSMVASTATYPHGRETITLHCEHASLVLSAETLEISWRDGRREHYPQTSKPQASASTPKHLWHQTVMEDFIDAIRQRRDPMVTGRDALEVHQLIDAIETSSREARQVSLP